MEELSEMIRKYLTYLDELMVSDEKDCISLEDQQRLSCLKGKLLSYWEMTESPCRLIECIYLNKAGISKGCTVSYPANGWVLNNGLVEDLVKERKKDFVKLVSFEIK